MESGSVSAAAGVRILGEVEEASLDEVSTIVPRRDGDAVSWWMTRFDPADN